MRFTGLLAALLFPCLVRADEAEKPLDIRLISETRNVVPGKPFFLGLHLVHPPGSHTYWKNPGIVGLATSIKWDLPPGFRAGEIQWPAPQVVKMATYDAQGYEGETLLIIPITPPEVLTSTHLDLTAKVSWMCCGKTCHPAVDVPLSINLPVSAVEEIDPANHALFGKFRELIPRPDPGLKSEVKREGGRIILTLDRETKQGDPLWHKDASIRFFTADGQVDTDQKQETRISADGTVVTSLIVSKTGPENPVTLPGVLGISTGGFQKFIEINPEY